MQNHLKHRRLWLTLALIAFGTCAFADPLPATPIFPMEGNQQVIQTAIDAADDGGIVILNPGTYRENLRITKPITLIGTEGVFLEPTDASAAAISITETAGVVIQGIAIRMANVGIEISRSSCSVVDCVISASEKGIHAILFDGNAVEISSSTLQSADQGVGLSLIGSGDAHVALCAFHGLATGLTVGGTMKVTALQCVFEGCFDGITALDTATTVLVENRIEDNLGSGIRVAHSPATSAEGLLMMIGNTIGRNGGTGLTLCGLTGEAPAEAFGTIQGIGNTISGNAQGNVCPLVLALPEGFALP